MASEKSSQSQSCVPVWVSRRQISSQSNRSAGDTIPWVTAIYDQDSNEFRAETGDKWVRDVNEELFLRNSVTSADMTSLDHIHEPAVLSNLADRWQNQNPKQPYTFMSVVLISLNPCEWLINPKFESYRDLPFNSENPHPYALAELAFQQLSLASSQASLSSSSSTATSPSSSKSHRKRRDEKNDITTSSSSSSPINQSIIISGESGAGKTETAKMILPYLTTCGGSSSISMDNLDRAKSLDLQLVQTNPIFECFGNAKTLRNHNSSRFGKFTTLSFEPISSSSSTIDLVLKCARLETYLLERSRVTAPSLGERNFHSFYQLLSADRNVREKVGLANMNADRFDWLNCTKCFTDKRLNDFSDWQITEKAMITCGLNEQERLEVWGGIGAILHLGNLKFKPTNQSYKNNDDDGKKSVGKGGGQYKKVLGVSDGVVVSDGVALVAELLALSDDEALNKFLTMRSIKTVQETLFIPLSSVDASHCRDGLARFLYDAVFEYLVSTMNHTVLGSGLSSSLDDTEVDDEDDDDDVSEYESSSDDGIGGVVRFKHDVAEQTFLINTANESIQNTFNHFVFEAEMRLFREEGISLQMGNRWKSLGDDSDEEDILSSATESEFICPDNQACADALKIILKSIESVSREPEPSDAKFLRRISNQLLDSSSSASTGPTKNMIKKDNPSDFFRGGGRKGVKMDAFAIKHFAGEVCYTAAEWMAKNTDYLPEGSSELLGSSASCVLSKFRQGLVTAEDVAAKSGSSSVVKAANSSFLKKATVADNFMRSMHSLMSTLRSTQCSFIRCVKPNQALSPRSLDLPLVSSQLQSLGIIQTCEVLKAGLPTRVPHAVLLGSSGIGSAPSSIAQLMTNKPLIVRIALLLKLFDVPKDAYRVGKTRIFFKAGNIAAIRRILVQGLPMNEQAAVEITKQLLKQYDDAMKLAKQVSEFAVAVGPGSVVRAQAHRDEVNELLVGILAVKERTQQAALNASSLDAIAVKKRVTEVKSRVKVLASEERFVGMRSVTLLLRRAQDHSQVALAAAEGLASDLSEAVAACGVFENELTDVTETLSGKDTLEKDIAKLTQLAFSLDAATISLVANQAALRLETEVVYALKKRCERVAQRITPILENMSQRIRHFGEIIEPRLNDLSTAADDALQRVKQQQEVVAEAIAAAEDIVRPETGECDVVWIEEEVRVLEAISAEECKKPNNKPKSINGVLSNHEAEIVRARFFGAADENPDKTGGQGKRGLSKTAFKKLVIKLCDESAKAGSGILVGIPNPKDLDAAFEQADADHNNTVDADEFVNLYAQVKNGEVAGLSIPQRSFALLVNCRRRRAGWKIVGEELLRRHPPSIRRTNQAGVSALAAACHAGHLDVVKWCIEKGAEIDRGNMDGVTPVATAAARGHLEVVRALVECGADVMTGNADGDSVVAIACWEDHHNIVRYLGSRKGKVRLDSRNLDGITPLEVACMRGNLRSVMTLHDLGVNMDEVNEHGDTPFLIACWEGHIDVVKFLFRVGGGSAANRMNANGDTPLAVSAWEGHLHIVEFLVAVGVELHVRNADGLTAYDVAVMRQHPQVIEFLQSMGMATDGLLKTPSKGINNVSTPASAHDMVISHMISKERELLSKKSLEEENLEPLSDTTTDVTTPVRNQSDAINTESPNTMVKLSLLKAAAQTHTALRRLKSVEEAEKEGLLALSIDAPKKPIPPPTFSTSNNNSSFDESSADVSSELVPSEEKKSDTQIPIVMSKKRSQKENNGNNESENLTPAEPKKINRKAAAAAKLSARISTDTPILRRSMSGNFGSSSGMTASTSMTSLSSLNSDDPLPTGGIDDNELNLYDEQDSTVPSTPPRSGGSSSSNNLNTTPLSVTARKTRWDTPFLGKRVLVSGTNKKDINGCVGHASRFDSKMGRYVIKLENGRTFQLKACHLREWTPPSADPKSDGTPGKPQARESKWSRIRDNFHSAFNTSASNTSQPSVNGSSTSDVNVADKTGNDTLNKTSGNLVAGAAGLWEKKLAAHQAPPPVTRQARQPPRRTLSASAYSSNISKNSFNSASSSSSPLKTASSPNETPSTNMVKAAVQRTADNMKAFNNKTNAPPITSNRFSKDKRQRNRSSTSDNVMGPTNSFSQDKKAMNDEYAKDDNDVTQQQRSDDDDEEDRTRRNHPLDPKSQEYTEKAKAKLDWPAEYSHLNAQMPHRRGSSVGKQSESAPDTPTPSSGRPVHRRGSTGSSPSQISEAILQAQASLTKETTAAAAASPEKGVSKIGRARPMIAAVPVASSKGSLNSPLLNKEVVVRGTVKAEANGKKGTAIKYDDTLGRYIVRLEDGRLLRLKPQNLILFDNNETVQQLMNTNHKNQSDSGRTSPGNSINDRLALFEKKNINVNNTELGNGGGRRSRELTRSGNRLRSFSSSAINKSVPIWPPPPSPLVKTTTPAPLVKKDSEKIDSMKALFEKKTFEDAQRPPSSNSFDTATSTSTSPPRLKSNDQQNNDDDNEEEEEISVVHNNMEHDSSSSQRNGHVSPPNRRVGHGIHDNIYKKWMTDKFAAADDDDVELSMHSLDPGTPSPSSAGLKSRRSLANSYEVGSLQTSASTSPFTENSKYKNSPFKNLRTSSASPEQISSVPSSPQGRSFSTTSMPTSEQPLLVESNKGTDGTRNLTSYIPVRPTIAASNRSSPPTGSETTTGTMKENNKFLPASPPRKKSTSSSPSKQQLQPTMVSSLAPPARNKPSTSPLPQASTSSSVVASLLTPAALRRANQSANNQQQNQANVSDDLKSVVSSSLFPPDIVFPDQEEEEEGVIDDNDAIEVFENENLIAITPPREKMRIRGFDETLEPSKATTSNEFMKSGASSAPVKASRKMAKLKNFRKNHPDEGTVVRDEESRGDESNDQLVHARSEHQVGPRSYPLSNKLNVFIVSDDPRLNKYSTAFGVIEYNGHDAFEFGAVGQVTAKLDARPPPPGSPIENHEQLEALFTFRQLDDFHPDDVAKAKANTEQLLKQLEKDVALRMQLSGGGGASDAPVSVDSYAVPPTSATSTSSPAVSRKSTTSTEAVVEPIQTRGRRDGDSGSSAPKSRRMRGMKLKDLRGGSRV